MNIDFPILKGFIKHNHIRCICVYEFIRIMPRRFTQNLDVVCFWIFRQNGILVRGLRLPIFRDA